MPSSHYITITTILKEIMRLNPLPKKVLDVGIGFGKWGFLLREMLDIQALRYEKASWSHIIDGVEIFENYIKEYHHYFYDNIFITDIRTLQYQEYDLVIFGDIIEHLPKEEAIHIIRYAQQRAIHVFLSTPLGFQKQGECLGNVHETHLCGFEQDDFEKLGFRAVEVVDDLQNYNMLIGVWTRELSDEELHKKSFQAWKEAYEKGYVSLSEDHRKTFYHPSLRDIGYYTELARGKRIVEFAPRDGTFIEKIIKESPHKRFFLIDISEHNLEQLRHKMSGFSNVEFFLNETGKVRLENVDSAFSFLLSQCMLKRLWKGHLKEVFGMLRTGGSYVFQFAFNPSLHSADSIENAIAGSQVYEKDEMSRLVQEAGFTNIDITPALQLPGVATETVWYFCKAVK